MKLQHCIPTSSVLVFPHVFPWDSDTSVQSKSHEIQILPLLHDRICDKTWDGATSQGPDLGSTGWDGGVPWGDATEGSLRTRNGSDKGCEGARGRAFKTTQKLGESGGVASEEKRVKGGCQETINYMGASNEIIWFVVLWFLICCFFTELGLATLNGVNAAQKIQNWRVQNLVPNTAKSRRAKYPNHLPKKPSNLMWMWRFFLNPLLQVDNQSHCEIFPNEALKKV